MVAKPSHLMKTSERHTILTESADKLKALFVETFGKNGVIVGNDGNHYKVADVLKDPALFAKVTRRD